MDHHSVTAAKPVGASDRSDGRSVAPRATKEIDGAIGIRPQSTKDGNRAIRHLNQIELSRRWSISPRTLERWRWLGQGPCFLKIGGRVVYRLEEIEAFEAQQMRGSTAVVSTAATCRTA